MKLYFAIALVFSTIFSCTSPTTDKKDSLPVDTTTTLAPSTAASLPSMTPVNRDSLKVTPYKTDALTIKITKPFQKGTDFIFDRYDDSWRYRKAERGSIFLKASVSITAKENDPKLPVFLAHTLTENGHLLSVGRFSYEFARWEDYGTYLGNSADFGNDFAHTGTIKFELGLQVKNEAIGKDIVYVFASNEGCLERKEDRFGNPPVSYSLSDCGLDDLVVGSEILNNYTLVAIIKK